MIAPVLILILCGFMFLKLLYRKGVSPLMNLSAIFVCFTALIWGYQQVVVRGFEYMGFIWQPDLLRIALAYFTVLVLGYFIPSKLSQPSNYFLQLWYMFAYLPVSVLYAVANFEAGYMAYTTICLGLIILLHRMMPKLHIPTIKYSRITALVILVGLTIVTYSLLIQHLGFRIGFSLEGVYEIRDVYKNIGIPFLGYLTIWQGYVLNPILLGIGIQQKKTWLIVLSVFLTYALMSITGIKSFLIGAVLIGVIAIMLKLSSRSKALFAVGIASLAAVSSIVYNSGNIWFPSLGFRRLLFTPALLNYRFYQFFSENPKTLLGYSVFSNFVEYPYDLPPAGLIARLYNPEASSGANAGFMADAYANFGFIGMLVFSIIVVILLRFIDGFSIKRKTLFVLMPLVMPLFALVNSALLTSLLTHGILFGIAMSWLLVPLEKPTMKRAPQELPVPVSVSPQ